MKEGFFLPVRLVEQETNFFRSQKKTSLGELQGQNSVMEPTIVDKCEQKALEIEANSSEMMQEEFSQANFDRLDSDNRRLSLPEKTRKIAKKI